MYAARALKDLVWCWPKPCRAGFLAFLSIARMCQETLSEIKKMGFLSKMGISQS